MTGTRPVAEVRPGAAAPTAVARRYWHECLHWLSLNYEVRWHLLITSATTGSLRQGRLIESPRQPPPEREPQMRVGISGTHGTGKTSLAGALCERLPGHVTADEPYYLLEEEGYDFRFPPSLEDYRALLARSLQSLSSPPLLPGIVFDRTPLDYLAYMAAIGADPADEASVAAFQPAFASLDLLVITLITPETEQVLPPAEMPGLRSEMNDALVELVRDDPLNVWEDIPVLELDGPLDGRLGAVLAALDQAGRPARRH